jgi:hypothetical protein
MTPRKLRFVGYAAFIASLAWAFFSTGGIHGLQCREALTAFSDVPGCRAIWWNTAVTLAVMLAGVLSVAVSIGWAIATRLRARC